MLFWGEKNLAFVVKLKIFTDCDPETPFLGIVPKKHLGNSIQIPLQECGCEDFILCPK